jgi:methylthioribose-1-phosphate isomerase
LPAPIAWTADHGVRLLDQTLLPNEERYLEIRSVDAMAEAIRSLRVRGAPLIGIAAAMGVVQALRGGAADHAAALAAVERACAALGATRPTAVNLHWALERIRHRAQAALGGSGAMRAAMVAEADAIWAEDRAMCARIGDVGAALLPDPATILTHCNAGALATGGIGTALAPVYTAHAAGRRVYVVATETRPVLQGSRLTAWELTRAGVPCTVIADSMAAARLRPGGAHCRLPDRRGIHHGAAVGVSRARRGGAMRRPFTSVTLSRMQASPASMPRVTGSCRKMAPQRSPKIGAI